MLTIREIAEVAHEVNKAYCDVLGDDSQPFWEDAPQWQTDSAMDGVMAIKNKLVTRPEQSHENWLKEKFREGWTWGKVKDPEKKTHYCMLPFNQLSVEQQMKDRLFFAVVTALLGR